MPLVFLKVPGNVFRVTKAGHVPRYRSMCTFLVRCFFHCLPPACNLVELDERCSTWTPVTRGLGQISGACGLVPGTLPLGPFANIPFFFSACRCRRLFVSSSLCSYGLFAAVIVCCPVKLRVPSFVRFFLFVFLWFILSGYCLLPCEI